MLVPERGPRLRIIAINDIYVLDRLPRLPTLKADLQRNDPVDRTLVTLAGDFLAPSLLSSLDHGKGMVDVLNAVGITHVTLGNHEDDLEPAELLKRMSELDAVWLGSNTPELHPAMRALDVVEVRGQGGHAVRVGLLGVVLDEPTIYRRAPFGGTRLLPALQTAREIASRLFNEQHVDTVIPLTHLAIADDRQLAHEQRDPPFPVILGGHEHTEIIDRVEGTTIVKAGQDARLAAIIELEWKLPMSEKCPRPPTVTVRLEPLANHAEDPAVRARVDKIMEVVDRVRQATLMRLPPGVQLSSVDSRKQQTTVGYLLASRIREVMGADLCFLNGGGLRGSTTYTDRFTYADLEGELPFDNEVVVIPMTGAEILACVGESRARAPKESGGYLQVDDGVVVSDDGRTILSIGGSPIDEQGSYRVAVIRNLLLGMDRIGPLMRLSANYPERVPPEGSGREIKLVVIEAFGAMVARDLGGRERVDLDGDGTISVNEIAEALAEKTS